MAKVDNTRKGTQTLSENIFNEYLQILRNNVFIILIVFLVSVVITVSYVINAVDIYKSTTTLKILRPQGSILSTQIMPEFQDFQTDRFILNEIEILKSYTIRERVASTLLDSLKLNPANKNYYYLLNKHNKTDYNKIILLQNLTNLLSSITYITQKRGLDIAEIEVESPSSYEAQLIANVYAETYLNYSIDFSRRELTTIKDFLAEEKNRKAEDLKRAESNLMEYQQRGGIIFLTEQAQKLVDLISTFDATKNTVEVEYNSKMKALNEIKKQLEGIDISVLQYIEGQLSEPYITELQRKIAELEAQKEIELTIPADVKLKEKLTGDYDKKIEVLKKTLEEKVSILRKGILSRTPEEKRLISQKYFELNIETQTDKARLASISKMLGKYEREFSTLPAHTIEVARLERERKSSEKLYLALEEKYQEALVNERAQLGNVNIVDRARLATKPSKPNRPLIIVVGSLIGLVIGISFAFVRNRLDRSIKYPEEIEAKGIPLLGWIPSIAELNDTRSAEIGFIIANKPNSIASEAFKALRTRVIYSKIASELRTILITSSVPREGKTVVSVNLAGSFALAEKKVLLLDADLRKPRVHSIFGSERFPGLSDYLFEKAELKDIMRESPLKGLYYVTSGTIPPNPSELLGSTQMLEFVARLKEQFDVIIADSPPFISITDAEILSQICDGTILIVLANKTPFDAVQKVYERIVDLNPHKFLGTVLNNFSVKSAYGYYYNYYYYYYSGAEFEDLRRTKQIKR
ncbi:MAG: GumC family protein [Ignavibacteria bacterium]